MRHGQRWRMMTDVKEDDRCGGRQRMMTDVKEDDRCGGRQRRHNLYVNNNNRHGG
jgi:hypothetical protein